MLMLALAAAAVAASPQTCTRPGWDKLSVLTGDWTVPFTFRTAPGHFEQGVSRSHAHLGTAPCTIIDELRGTLDRKPIAFLSVLTITPEGGLERAYMDSEHGLLLHYKGAFQGKVAALSMDYPANPKFGSRAELDFSDPRQPRITHLLSVDNGQSWQPVIVFRYGR